MILWRTVGFSFPSPTILYLKAGKVSIGFNFLDERHLRASQQLWKVMDIHKLCDASTAETLGTFFSTGKAIRTKHSGSDAQRMEHVTLTTA